MPRNVEIKARLDNVQLIAPTAAALSHNTPIEIVQDDTFFRCDHGRIKLRAFSPTSGELIFYRRGNEQGPKESHYLRSPTSSPDSLREALSQAYGQAGRVRKHRTVYIVGRTRIHLDVVQDLGHFLELEVVLEDGEPVEQGIREAHSLMAKLGVAASHLVAEAYVDLLTAESFFGSPSRNPA